MGKGQAGQTLRTERGAFVLACRPASPRRRAWDAADEYLLEQAAQVGGEGAVLLANDSYGALAVGCRGRERIVVLDSLVAQQASAANLAANDAGADLRFVRSTEGLENWGVSHSLALLRIPSSRSYLEFLLERLRRVMRPGACLLAAGMARHLYPGLAEIFERCFGEAKVERVRKKALLVRAACRPPAGPLPETFYSYTVPEYGCTVFSLPNVFSRKGLDAGSRLLLETLDRVDIRGQVADLGCGSGVLGLVAAKTKPGIRLTAVDDSHLAVEAANRTFKANKLEARVRCADGLAGQAAGSLDWVIANPPFHRREVAARLFRQAARCLNANGAFLLVCRERLGYRDLLHRVFAQIETLEGRGPYRVWLCRPRPNP